MTSQVVNPNSLQDDPRLDFRVPGHPVESCQDDYINCIVDELVLRTTVLGLDLRIIIKEFENKTKSSGLIHMNQLYEALRRAGVRISDSDFSMLLRKYQVHEMFLHVPSLLEDMDSALRRLQNKRGLKYHPLVVLDEIQKSQMKVDFPKVKRLDEKVLYPKEYFEWQDTTHPGVDRWPSRENTTNTILRIQKYCLAQRRRAEEFFRAFDRINCGKITKSQFLRGLDSLATVTGQHSRLQIAQTEAEAIATLYADIQDPNSIHWHKFVKDLLEVEAPQDLISQPSAPVESASSAVELLHKLPGRYAGGPCFSKQELLRLESAVSHVKRKLVETKAHLLPFFRSYDKLNHGFVNPVQFRRVMSSLKLPLTDGQAWILTKYYSEKEGFNYRKFVPEVGQEDTLKPYMETKPSGSTECAAKPKAAAVPSKPSKPSFETEERTIQGVLAKIKSAVHERRLRPAYYLEQFDELRHGAVDRHTFRQALSSTFDFPLSETEYEILMDTFCDPFERNLILYRRFLSAVNEVDYLDGLDKAPLLVPLTYLPMETAPRRQPYNRQETEALEAVWKKIAGKISLKDWDTFLETKGVLNVTQRRSTTRSGLERSLDKLGVLRLLSPRELDLLQSAFSVRGTSGRELLFDWAAFLRSADIIYRKLKSLY